MFSLRKVESGDVPFLYLLMNREEIRAVLHEEPTTLISWEETFREWKRDRDEENYIILEDSLPVGWIGVNNLLSEDKIPYIKMAAVIPEKQNYGVGEYGVQRVVKSLKMRGYKAVRLYTDRNNMRAQRCYKKCGFSPVKKEKEDYGKRLMMQCSLEDSPKSRLDTERDD